MKKIVSSLVVAGMMTFGFSTVTFAEEQDSLLEQEVVVDETEEVDPLASMSLEASDEVITAVEEDETEQGELNFTSKLKQKFIEGDPFWMGIVLIALIIGLALCIERIVYLNLSSINTKKFILDVEQALASGGVEEAKELCRNTRGPIASIYFQGLDRSNEGIEAVEKSVVSYGGVQMGLLEK